MLTEEEQAFVEVVHRFVDKDVRPVVRDLEHANTYPEALIEQMKELGVYGMTVPAPYGMSATSTECYTLVTEEIARGWMSLSGAFGGHSVVCRLIDQFGTEEQRQRYLPRLATGELRATMALTEPGGGSDLQAMRTVARRDGDDYVIDGRKTWITNARRAGVVALLCKTDPSAQPAHRGISILLVEKVPGFEVSRDLPKLGYKGVESCELSFQDCRVPAGSAARRRGGRGLQPDDGGAGDRPDPGRARVRSASAGPPSRTRWPTPRSARRSACRSGSTSRWATTSPTWRPS